MLGSVILVSICLLCVIGLLLLLASGSVLPLLASSFDAEKMALIKRLLYLLLPCILFKRHLHALVIGP